MPVDKYKPSVGYAAGVWMLKWDDLYAQLQQQPLQILAGDNVNVFINFECILRNLAQRNNLQADLVYYKKEICIELESSILNLVAHYRGYFKVKHRANPKIYFYYTDLLSDLPQEMSSYNKYYRSYYKNRYLQNPQFKELGKVLTNIVIPEVSLIMNYIPDCYFIKTSNFDSTLVPQIVSTFDNAKTVVITGDVFDTLYMNDPEKIVVYIKRRFQHFSLCTSVESTVQSIIKNESPFDLTIFNAKMYFRLLLSIKGSKIRNIKASRGFGYSRFVKILSNGMKKGVVLKDFSSIDSIIDLFPEQYRDDIKTAFLCTSIETQMNLVNDINIEEVRSQIVDKIDIRSVEALNNKRFFEFPINLPYLIN